LSKVVPMATINFITKLYSKKEIEKKRNKTIYMYITKNPTKGGWTWNQPRKLTSGSLLISWAMI